MSKETGGSINYERRDQTSVKTHYKNSIVCVSNPAQYQDTIDSY